MLCWVTGTELSVAIIVRIAESQLNSKGFSSRPDGMTSFAEVLNAASLKEAQQTPASYPDLTARPCKNASRHVTVVPFVCILAMLLDASR